MNTPGKLKALLGAAGFRQPHTEITPCSHPPTLQEVIAQHTAPGVAGRRLARLDPHARAAFLHSVRSRLENLSPEDFINRSEVITALAVAR